MGILATLTVVVLKCYRKDYGGFAPFFVNAGPQALLVVREPSQIRRVLAAADTPKPMRVHTDALDKLFGLPQLALVPYTVKNVSQMDKAALENAYINLPKKYLTGTLLSTSIDTYVSILSKNMNNKMFQAGSWTQIEDIWSFFQQVITRCTLESLFGSDLFKQYPSVVRDYWEFADAAEGFIPGLPRYWVPSAASQARDRLLRGIEKWLKANHSGSDFARTAEEDPAWDGFKGSEFLQERDIAVASLQGMDVTARAAEMLSIMHE